MMGGWIDSPWTYGCSIHNSKSTEEQRLSAAGIRSRGLAKGDLKLGHFASLRNEVGSLGVFSIDALLCRENLQQDPRI